MTLMDTTQLLGNFGEFFGAIAVLATLVFLGPAGNPQTDYAKELMTAAFLR